MRITTAVVAILAALLSVTVTTQRGNIPRHAMPPDDGWAAMNGGVTGGSAADADHVYRATNRRELVAALNFPSAVPKIVVIEGTIDANVDDNNRPLSCTDYYRQGYTQDAFLAFYNPAGAWGPRPPENVAGSLEAARRASANAQRDRMRISIPDNTTIVGSDSRARIRGGQFDIAGTSTARRRNVIIRNLTFEDVFDCFPAWTPGTTSSGAWSGTGEWDSERDAIALREAENIWIDHNTFRDVDTHDRTLPTIFGAKFQIHDGLVDITNASDLVTVSWNRFEDHDKTMLIGSSDNAPADAGRLRVTVHHNLFKDVGQRAPRVRYGQVHVYNNLYRVTNASAYSYSWGVGVQPAGSNAGIYAEGNVFETPASIGPERFISRFNGTSIHATGTLHDTGGGARPVDAIAAYNAARDPDLVPSVPWTPRLFLAVYPATSVSRLVWTRSGPFNW